MEAQKIKVEATITATISKVWDYWTLPQHITNWNFASADWHCPKATNDIKTGGKFSFTMAAKDGSMSFDFEGIYDEVKENQRIAYSLADGRKVEIDFTDLGDNKVNVIEVFDGENTHSAEMQKAGWQAILNNFKKYVETT
jgi:uncharacterized protein YndB with AHSA1/START domain